MQRRNGHLLNICPGPRGFLSPWREEREKRWKKTSVSWYVKCQLTSRDWLTSNQWQHTCQLPQPIPVCYEVPRKIKKTVTCYQRFFLTTSLFLFFSRRKKTSGPRVQLLLFICNTCSWAEFCPVSLASSSSSSDLNQSPCNVTQDSWNTSGMIMLRSPLKPNPTQHTAWTSCEWPQKYPALGFLLPWKEKREKEAARENLWLWAMQISLSCYDRCHENRFTSNQ